LRVRDLEVDFTVHGGTVEAVKDVSFRVPAGRTVALVGESGSGKSVIAQTILGILPRNGRIGRGEILFNDPDTDAPPVDLARLHPEKTAYRRIRGGRISMIFQEPMTSLSPLYTVGNQVAEAVRLHCEVTREEALQRTAEILGHVGFPSPEKAIRTFPFELSGGLRQRAMIAMALICRPALLIADEPTTALDVTIQAQILKLMRDIQAELGMAMLMITHDLGVVANIADEVVVLYRGRVMEAGPLDAIFRNPKHPYLKALLRAVPRFHMAKGERLQPIRTIEAEVGGKLMAERAARPAAAVPANGPAGTMTTTSTTDGPLLEASGLTKWFRIRKGGALGGDDARILAVDDVGLKIDKGECLGLVGESGCGKTTLSKILMRALTPDAGWILYNDHGTLLDVLSLKDRALKAFRQRMQFMFQDPFSALNPRMTVLDIITEPMVIHEIGDTAHRRDMAKELMHLVGLDTRALQRYPHSFSGGQRQRIGIARALALRPDLIICDEPVSALDVSIQAQILNLLHDLREQLGLTYLFISHNLAVVDYIADRIMVMCRGRIVETARRETLFRNPVHPYTRALLAAVPHPDPRQPLDLAQLMDERASEPTAWPYPFTISARSHPGMIELGEGHQVRAHSDPNELELAS
jgi:peptide/nickel transport system ATP-binding protein